MRFSKKILDFMDQPVLKVTDLHIGFTHEGTYHEVVKGISFNVRRGTTLGIVGESGSRTRIHDFPRAHDQPQPRTAVWQTGGRDATGPREGVATGSPAAHHTTL